MCVSWWWTQTDQKVLFYVWEDPSCSVSNTNIPTERSQLASVQEGGS